MPKRREQALTSGEKNGMVAQSNYRDWSATTLLCHQLAPSPSLEVIAYTRCIPGSVPAFSLLPPHRRALKRAIIVRIWGDTKRHPSEKSSTRSRSGLRCWCIIGGEPIAKKKHLWQAVVQVTCIATITFPWRQQLPHFVTRCLPPRGSACWFIRGCNPQLRPGWGFYP